MRRILPILLLPLLAVGQRPDQVAAPEPKQLPVQEIPLSKLPNFNDALRWAEEDAMLIGQTDLPFIRWLWDRDAQPQDTAFTLNITSRGTEPIRVPELNGGRLVRVDLRVWAPTAQDLADWLAIWEKLEFDPETSLLLTADTLANLPLDMRAIQIPTQKEEWTQVDIPITIDGVRYDRQWKKRTVQSFVAIADIRDVVVVRIDRGSLDTARWQRLKSATRSRAPVVELNYFIARALAAIKEDGLYEQLLGGLYYELAGIPRAGQKSRAGGSDEDALYASIGVGDGSKGSAAALLDRLRSDERTAVFRRNLNKKPSRIDWFGTPNSRLSLAAGVVFVTHDLRDKDIEVGQHPIKNLVNFKDAAREVIFTKRNGFQGYALYDSTGKLLEEAAPDVASDWLIPKGQMPRLQSGISCIRCHGAQDGWHPLHNDVKAMLRGGIDVFGDIRELNKTIPDTLDRLRGWYNGDPRKPLSRARDDYAEAVLRATGPWRTSKTQADVVQLASASVAERWKRYWWDDIDAKVALYELGYRHPGKELETFRALLPSIPGQRESPAIAALKAGLSIGRREWILDYGFAADRAAKSWERIQK